MDTVITTAQPSLLQAILEGLLDGVLILTEQGEWIHANDRARRICGQLTQGMTQPDRVPHEIWQACQCLISRLNDPNKALMIEDEITTDQAASYRVRAQWLTLERFQRPCLLVTLEDRLQSVRQAAIAEGQHYGLTPRELEVWLHYRANDSYKAIAAELYITHNTVKKHMKNIHAKRQIALAIAQ